jgi:uncharacterized coiled-coil protein SlyX
VDQLVTNMETRLLQLELSMDAAKRDIEELKQLLMDLSYMVNQMQTQVNYLMDGKGKEF